jgi:peptidoglycan/LPS O-acetylase OafA/YrhL
VNERYENRYAGIDLLRGFSALLVVLSHYGVLRGFFLGGTHGVAIFFIVSGYCMSYSTRDRSGGQFMAARLWRLVPTLVVCATITHVLESTLPEIRPDRLQTVKDYVANLACLPNANVVCDVWYDLRRGHAVSYNWVDGAYWSLLVEFRFYLLLWALFYVLKLGNIAFWVATLGLLAPLGASTPWISGAQDFLLYLAFFAFGLAYRQWCEGERGAGAIVVYAFAVFLFDCILGSPGLSMSLNKANALSYAFCFVIFAACLRLFRSGRNRVVSFFGVISYPLYLLHQDIGYIVMKAVDPAKEGYGAAVAIAAVLLTAIAVNVAIQRYQPKIRAGLARLRSALPNALAAADRQRG